MADNSAIEWTDATWNPIVGCSILSPGCTNCYAMKMAARIQKMNRTGGSNSNYVNHYDGTTKSVKGNTVWTGKLAMAPDKLFLKPLSRRAPTTYFVNSMGDLFHEDCPDEWIDRVFAVMALSPQHTFQVLTKRAKRMRVYMLERWQPTKAMRVDLGGGDVIDVPAETTGTGRRDQVQSAIDELVEEHGLRERFIDTENDAHWTGDGEPRCMQFGWPLPNVWLGVSTERQQEADERIPLLLQTPAAIRFISAEPLLGHIALHALNLATPTPSDALRGVRCVPDDSSDGYHNEPTAKLDWVIVGGESGHAARPMHPDWARDLRDQCASARVPFFFKQWGEWAPGECADFLPTRTERTATWFADEWSFGALTPKASEETHYDDAPDLYRIGKKRASRTLDGVEHNAFPERAR